MEEKTGRRDETENLGKKVKSSFFIDGGSLRVGVLILQTSPRAEAEDVEKAEVELAGIDGGSALDG